MAVLKFNYGHAMYVLDLSERTKGLQLLTLSHSQFKDLDERKLNSGKKSWQRTPVIHVRSHRFTTHIRLKLRRERMEVRQSITSALTMSRIMKS